MQLPAVFERLIEAWLLFADRRTFVLGVMLHSGDIVIYASGRACGWFS